MLRAWKRYTGGRTLKGVKVPDNNLRGGLKVYLEPDTGRPDDNRRLSIGECGSLVIYKRV